MKLKNRFVRSATWEGMATDDGACTPKLIDLIANLLCTNLYRRTQAEYDQQHEIRNSEF